MRISSGFLFVSLLFLAGCATPVLVDYEKAADFSKYRTFAVDASKADGEARSASLSPIVDRRIERAIVDTLKGKGLEAVDGGADLQVVFHTATHTRTEINDWRVGTSPFRRYPYYSYAHHSFIDINEYEEGTFIIDLVDSASGQLVWRGASNKRLGWTALSQDEVDAVVGRILSAYPPGTEPAS